MDELKCFFFSFSGASPGVTLSHILLGGPPCLAGHFTGPWRTLFGITWHSVVKFESFRWSGLHWILLTSRIFMAGREYRDGWHKDRYMLLRWRKIAQTISFNLRCQYPIEEYLEFHGKLKKLSMIIEHWWETVCQLENPARPPNPGPSFAVFHSAQFFFGCTSSCSPSHVLILHSPN